MIPAGKEWELEAMGRESGQTEVRCWRNSVVLLGNWLQWAGFVCGLNSTSLLDVHLS